MDSTISMQPSEAPDSLHRARRAAWGSFAGAVVDWYDFLLYGITAALVFNREFFPANQPGDGHPCRVCHLRRRVSFSPAGRDYLWPLRRPSRAQADADDDRLDDGYRHRLHRPAPVVQPDRLVGAGAAGVSAGGSGLCRRRRMGRRGAALGGETRRREKKPFTAAGCRWATASACCSPPGWYR